MIYLGLTIEMLLDCAVKGIAGVSNILHELPAKLSFMFQNLLYATVLSLAHY
jgi:hypothetical protein